MEKSLVLKSGKTLIIRQSKEQDAMEIIDYLNAVGGESDYLTFGLNEFFLSTAEEAEFLKGMLSSQNEIHLLGTINGEIVTVANISASPKERLKHVGELGISVKKMYWKEGIGRGMLDYMLTWATENSIIKKIMLRVHEDNHSAKRLYDSLGFQNEGKLSKDFYLNGIYSDAILMGKWIG